MDTSKEYIKMCESAEEIQKIFYNDREFDKRDFMEWIKKPTGKVVIWLPRQDQLQEMVKKETDGILCEAFYIVTDFWFEVSYSSDPNIDEKINMCKWSMEQLWLAFVMKEKYKKIWNGTEWLNQSH